MKSSEASEQKILFIGQGSARWNVSSVLTLAHNLDSSCLNPAVVFTDTSDLQLLPEIYKHCWLPTDILSFDRLLCFPESARDHLPARLGGAEWGPWVIPNRHDAPLCAPEALPNVPQTSEHIASALGALPMLRRRLNPDHASDRRPHVMFLVAPREESELLYRLASFHADAIVYLTNGAAEDLNKLAQIHEGICSMRSAFTKKPMTHLIVKIGEDPDDPDDPDDPGPFDGRLRPIGPNDRRSDPNFNRLMNAWGKKIGFTSCAIEGDLAMPHPGLFVSTQAHPSPIAEEYRRKLMMSRERDLQDVVDDFNTLTDAETPSWPLIQDRFDDFVQRVLRVNRLTEITGLWDRVERIEEEFQQGTFTTRIDRLRVNLACAHVMRALSGDAEAAFKKAKAHIEAVRDSDLPAYDKLELAVVCSFYANRTRTEFARRRATRLLSSLEGDESIASVTLLKRKAEVLKNYAEVTRRRRDWEEVLTLTTSVTPAQPRYGHWGSYIALMRLGRHEEASYELDMLSRVSPSAARQALEDPDLKDSEPLED